MPISSSNLESEKDIEKHMLANVLPFTLSLTFIPVFALGLSWGGVWTLAPAIQALILVPIIDYFAGLRTDNLDPALGEEHAYWYRVLTWAWVPLQLLLLAALLAVAGLTTDLSKGELLLLAVSLGLITGGVGITYAHELMHQTNRFERALSEVLMTSTLYGHFCVEHVHGHHIKVGTPDDPVTARFGEGFYRFLPRAVFGGLRSAWEIQRKRNLRRNIPFVSLANPFFRYALLYSAYCAVSFGLAGRFGVLLFLVQSGIAIILLEIVNYIEHYGLTRRKVESGRYERVQPWHSWNASHRVTNYLLINLQRHSDHHANPQRRFPALQHCPEDEAPQLPFGYATMLTIALFPPLWFHIMNPKVEAWRTRFPPHASAMSA